MARPAKLYFSMQRSVGFPDVDWLTSSAAIAPGLILRFRHITLPLLRPTVLLLVVVSIIMLSKAFTSVLVSSSCARRCCTFRML